ncbi:hypothetical protein Tco_0265805 [Tanacetum coccineum]
MVFFTTKILSILHHPRIPLLHFPLSPPLPVYISTTFLVLFVHWAMSCHESDRGEGLLLLLILYHYHNHSYSSPTKELLHHHTCPHQLLFIYHHCYYSASVERTIMGLTYTPQRRLVMILVPRYKVGESSAAAAARPAGGLRADYGFVATMDREIRRDPERYVGYGITDLWDEIVETLQAAPVSTNTELGAHVREFESMVRRDTYEIYMMLDDEQSQRQLLAGRVNMLDASDLARAEVMSLRTTVHAQMSEIREFSSQQIIDTTERSDSTFRIGPTLQGQGQLGTRWGPAQPELPEEAGAVLVD